MNQQGTCLLNLTSADSLQNLYQLYTNIAPLNLSSQQNAVDTSHLFYRIGNSQHFGLTDDQHSLISGKQILTNVRISPIESSASASSSPSSRKSHAFIGSTSSENNRKQYHQWENNLCEYMLEDLVKVVITGIEHAGLLVSLEDVGPIDYF
ncbi:3620_t:CDS:2 [Ambispora gerdemannii]|uniref:3620_t:CDS:1 n=1 Tax=Ambispora gerdemannii TaxID=144530 RepID=A0A9N8VMC0_9GLOM|nr:3620_t:CDS:2 [Ambispora gerdemannii]